MRKRFVSMLLAGLCFALLPAFASADSAKHGERVRVSVSDPGYTAEDNKLLFDAYVYELFYPADVEAAGTYAGAKLTGSDAVVYSALRACISDVADGMTESACFAVPVNSLGLAETAWTAEELGVDAILADGEITEAAEQAVLERACGDLPLILSSLLEDCPYELYWYDKTAGTSVWADGVTSSFDPEAGCDIVTISGDLIFAMSVAEGYSAGEYLVDASAVNTAKNAVRNAQSIAARYAASLDYDKLIGYKNEICGLVSYNTEALQENTAYGDPWQLVWVFDGDDSTDVVCEGYAKAFQYLCDLTSFSGDICCYTVTGIMSGGTGAGAHMWNVVRMEDGYAYLLDVTNCDAGTVGESERLFLAGCTGGDATDGYCFEGSGGAVVRYAYSAESLALFSQEELSVRNAYYIYTEPGCLAAGVLDGGQRWTIDDKGVLTISGSGAIIYACDAPWYPYADSISKCVVGEGITELSILSADALPQLTELFLPDSLEMLGSGTFMNCELLESVSLGSGITKIGQHCFYNCRSLREVSIPASVRFISHGAFWDCVSLERVEFSPGLVRIGQYCFDGCVSLKEIELPATIETIEEGAFRGCQALERAVVPAGIIGKFVFSDNTSLTSLELGTDVCSIGVQAFIGCTALSGPVIIPEGITVLEQGLFYACTNLIGVVLPESLERIEGNAFCMSGITSIGIPDRVTYIGKCAFQWCSNLKTIHLGNSVKTIDKDALCYTGLTSLHLPASVEAVNLRNNDYLETITVDENNQHYSSVNGIMYDKQQSVLLCCPSKYSGEIVIPETVSRIEKWAFSNCGSLQRIQLPDSVIELGEYAFYNCTNLETVVLSNAITRLPAFAFSDCYQLTELDLPNGLAAIDQYAFNSCSSLTSLHLPASVSQIEPTAFSRCHAVLSIDPSNPCFTVENHALFSKDRKTIITVEDGIGSEYAIPDGVENISENCFYGKTELSAVHIPDSVKTIGDYAFAFCGIETVSIEGNDLVIGSGAFVNCYELRAVRIPNDVLSIGGDAFGECRSLDSIEIGAITGSVGGTIVRETAYYHDPSNWDDGGLYLSGWLVATDLGERTELIVRAGTCGIAEYACYCCGQLETVSMPDSVKSIGSRSFEQCRALRELTLSNGVEYIGDWAFCTTSLTELLIPASARYIGKQFLGLSDYPVLVFTGHCPVFHEEAFQNAFELSVFYPAGDESWTDVIGAQFGASEIHSIDEDGNILSTFPGAAWFAYDPATGSTFIPGGILPSDLDIIEESAFENSAFESIRLPESVREIQSQAFHNCPALRLIYIPQSVQQIADDAFDIGTGLVIIGVDGSAAQSYAEYWGFAFMEIEAFAVPLI